MIKAISGLDAAKAGPLGGSSTSSKTSAVYSDRAEFASLKFRVCGLLAN